MERAMNAITVACMSFSKASCVGGATTVGVLFCDSGGGPASCAYGFYRMRLKKGRNLIGLTCH